MIYTVHYVRRNTIPEGMTAREEETFIASNALTMRVSATNATRAIGEVLRAEKEANQLGRRDLTILEAKLGF